jgi:hypothetical protein
MKRRLAWVAAWVATFLMVSSPWALAASSAKPEAIPNPKPRCEIVKGIAGPLNYIVGNAKGLAYYLAIPVLIVAIVGLMFTLRTRHRGNFLGLIGGIFFGLIALGAVVAVFGPLIPKGTC